MNQTTNDDGHKQVPILRDGETIFTVDEGIHSLLQYLFDKGIQTFNSCEANFDDYIWVEYKLEDWMGITSRAFQGNTYELMEFIEMKCALDLGYDTGCIDEDDNWIEYDDLIWTAGIRFPKEELEIFEQLLRETLG
jgi:hypothetical protein